MKPRLSTWLNLAWAAALVAILGGLVYKTEATDEAAHDALLADIRSLKQIDAEWNADVLRARVGLASDYDRIASPLPAIERLEAAVQARVGRDDLAAAFGSYKAAMDRKIELIERFKSQNAILRNSTRFLPVADNDVATLPAGMAPGTARVIELTRAIDAEVMTFSALPDEALRADIETHLAAVDAAATAWPASARDRVDVFAAHARTILRQQRAGAELLRAVDDLPTAPRLDALADLYLRAHSQALATQQRYRVGLIVYSSLLLVLLACIGWRLVRSFRRINELTAAALKKATTELDEAQLQLVQSAKMSALGQMVAGIAHEINTPLAFVKGSLDVVGEHMLLLGDVVERCWAFVTMLPDRTVEKSVLHARYRELHEQARSLREDGITDEAGALLQEGSRGIDQISEIVQNLKNFSRLDRAKIGDFDVREGIESTLVLARNLLKGKVEVVRQFDEVPRIQCSPSQINQVLLNIVTNAAQAIPAHGTITLRTAVENAGTVRIDIEDDGAGIAPEVLPKIFDPFFTTKGVGQGTGMGLSISYKIVEQHGGRITVSSEPGLGTVFSILLPVRQPAAGSTASGLPSALAA